MARICDVDDCDRKHSARGLCSMHWKREHGTRTMYPRTCDMCGVDYMSARPNGRFCDDGCKGLWYSDHGVRPSVGTKPLRICVLPDDHPVRMICPLDLKWCKCCGQEFRARPGARVYCTQTCAWRAKAKARGARHLGRREDIFERDAYVCWICDGPTSDRYSRTDIWSPTIDHLTPVSLGGTDEPDNLACAHMWCNSLRGNSLDISPAA